MQQTFLALAVLSAIAVQVSFACFASGVCGGGCPPPPPPVCHGGCGGGYGCGQYGCYRMKARARSAKTLSLRGSEEEAEQPKTPDEKFMQCCIDRDLPDSCLSKCSFRSYSKTALQAMYFKQDRCPMQAAADIHYCAAQGKDHTDCCYRNGVSTTLAGSKCMTFCDQRPGNVTQLDLTYLACYDRFDNMKACFWQDINREEQQPQLSFSVDETEPAQPRRLASARTFTAKTFQ
ncbi:unnamed protein product [Auanema sp. JU1783]|nr:unnamed protein product [Auanema sp. JU1783]